MTSSVLKSSPTPYSGGLTPAPAPSPAGTRDLLPASGECLSGTICLFLWEAFCFKVLPNWCSHCRKRFKLNWSFFRNSQRFPADNYKNNAKCQLQKAKIDFILISKLIFISSNFIILHCHVALMEVRENSVRGLDTNSILDFILFFFTYFPTHSVGTSSNWPRREQTIWETTARPSVFSTDFSMLGVSLVLNVTIIF